MARPATKRGSSYADWTLGCYSLLKTPTDSNTAAIDVSSVADTIPVNQPGEFKLGQILTLDSGDEDNSGVGFTVSAVNEAGSEITVTPDIPTDIVDGRLIQPWVPAATRVGDELGGRVGVTSWGTNFTNLKIISAEIPVDLQVADIPGQQGDGQYVTGLEYGRRQITWSMTLVHRPDYEAMQSHILLETEQDLTMTVGNSAGERVIFTLKNAKILTAEEIDGTPMQMRFTGTASADVGNDVLQIAFT